MLLTYNSNNTTKNKGIEMKMARNYLTWLVKFILRETAKTCVCFWQSKKLKILPEKKVTSLSASMNRMTQIVYTSVYIQEEEIRVYAD